MPGTKDDPEDLSGTTLGKCTLISCIGRGGMGLVYRARHTGLDKDVAVKVLPRELANNEALRARFMNEARLAGQLEHPNITPVYAVEESNGQPYIVMQLIDGVPVSRLVSRQGVDPLLAVKIAGQAARGLAYAHRRNLVHRDIKPDNLLILSNGRVKISDFGVAAAMGTESASGHSGSPPYMSPEQCRGEKVDGRSDIYSLGVTLYLLLTGRRPFLGETAQALILMHQQDEYPAISTLRPGLPRELERIVNRMLAKNPDARYPDAEELAEDLEAAAELIRSQRRRTVTVTRGGESGIYKMAQQAEEQASEEMDRNETIELAILSMTTQLENSVTDAQQALRRARYDEALKQIEQAMRLKADDARLFLLRGHIHRKMRKFDLATADYQRAVEINPDDPRARSFLGSLQRMAGDLSGARENLTYALKLNAHNVEARISLGKIYEKGKAWKAAEREYEKCIELVPADERGYVALAVLHISRKAPEKARPLLERALSVNPSFAETLFWLAVITAPEKPEEGLRLLERAVKNGFKDRKRLHDNPAFAKLEGNAAYQNLLKVFGHSKTTKR
ncbi:MAG: protein kinase [Planctomycetes bacterium]|jgi:serine/threonine protein kinase|nr:protein kinase [Planctomycetota bacterium]MCL4731449.1 protein kinase [Planctomycetota bacterium]